MTASQRRTVTVVVAALAVAFLLVWASAAGPPPLVAGQQQTAVAPSRQARPHQADHDTGDRHRTAADPHGSGTTDLAGWLQDLVAFALLLLALLVASLLLRQLFFRIRRGLAEERLVVPLEPLPDLAVGRAAVERDQERQRDALASSDVRNGIVACWVLFEEAAAESHVVKQPAETASAFVVRFLHSLDVDPRPVGALAQLFLEARFSTHPMAADARPRAEQALAAIHRDLAGTGATR